MGVIEEIAAERRRQIEVEGYPPDHDEYNSGGELAAAAACYALSASGPGCEGDDPPPMWPWVAEAWKPKNPRRDLIRAAALIVAEIERLDRAGLGDDEGSAHFADSAPEARAEGQSPAERPLTVTDEAKADSDPAVDLLRATVNRLMGERDALAGALRGLIVEMEGLPHSLGYEFTHLPEARRLLAQLDSVAPPLTPND